MMWKVDDPKLRYKPRLKLTGRKFTSGTERNGIFRMFVLPSTDHVWVWIIGRTAYELREANA